MRRRDVLLCGLIVLVVGAGTLVALGRVADELPKPVATAVRLPERLWTRAFSPRVPKRSRLAGLTPPEQDAVRALAGRVSARLVWSSNRSGNHELYLLDFASRSLRRLTRHPNVDFFLAFPGRPPDRVSAQPAGVGQLSGSGRLECPRRQRRRHRRTGDRTRGLPPRAGPRTAGRSSSIGTRRCSATIWRVDANRCSSTGRRRWPASADAGDFELAPDQRQLAFALRGPFEGAAVYGFDSHRLSALTRVQACQTTWAPDGRSVVWVELGAAAGRG